MQTYSGEADDRKKEGSGELFGVNTIVHIVPRNPISAAAKTELLSVIFIALVFGVALTRIPREKARPVEQVLDGVNEAIMKIVGMVMEIAPYAVAALIFSTTARFGWGIVATLVSYAACVLTGLAIHQFVVFSILLALLCRVNPVDFFRKITPVMVTAFSTSSSNATLPTSIRTAEEDLGVPPEIAGFVLPLGATMNMNGTALFEGVTCVFVAQVFGISLSLGQQAAIIVLSVITAVGAAGVPGGSIPLLMMVLETLGVPGGGIAIILGFDRILDMCRTVPNVTGDLTCAVFIARTEGCALKLEPMQGWPGSAGSGGGRE
ncbi:MAG: dicarboxylate/amino acid:cation symporter [Candidatus Riflebacteria bacterium]|nr:dicarboxylate/amino acid:cation symporter [Candidatus Riflebacteria bacterium]